jgi:hypothetical protein
VLDPEELQYGGDVIHSLCTTLESLQDMNPRTRLCDSAKFGASVLAATYMSTHPRAPVLHHLFGLLPSLDLVDDSLLALVALRGWWTSVGCVIVCDLLFACASAIILVNPVLLDQGSVDRYTEPPEKLVECAS